MHEIPLERHEMRAAVDIDVLPVERGGARAEQYRRGDIVRRRQAGERIEAALNELSALSGDELKRQRREKFLSIGRDLKV